MPPAVDGAFARWLAERTGELLVDPARRAGFAEPDALRAAADKHAHDLITTILVEALDGTLAPAKTSERIRMCPRVKARCRRTSRAL